MDGFLIAIIAIGALDVALVALTVRAHIKQARLMAKLDRQP